MSLGKWLPFCFDFNNDKSKLNFSHLLKTLMPRQDGHHFTGTGDIFNVFSWMKMCKFHLQVHWILFQRSNWQFTIFSSDNGLVRSGDTPLSIRSTDAYIRDYNDYTRAESRVLWKGYSCYRISNFFSTANVFLAIHRQSWNPYKILATSVI